ncbi:MAG: MBL fold metallo-hydrolase [Ectothiorhodospiraceae bacterium]|nr:MBL fold metallo-hydrolase [Ectothiorhodospiraceae bacterium]
MAQITFLGAVGEVTGSRYLIETDSATLLLECGLHQGGSKAEEQNRQSLAQLARQVDAVIVSHGHLDHSGLVPRLVHDGYRGPVYCTGGTFELLEIMWRDAAQVLGRELEWENRWRERAGKPLLEPVYLPEDVDQALGQCRYFPYGQSVDLCADARLLFRDAGHILGSAIVELNLQSGGREQRLVFSGDLGNPRSALMRDPESPDSADLVLLESTYGNRDHRPLEDTIEEFAAVLEDAFEQGGNVLIPAFAVGRTQEILFHLGTLRRQGRLRQQRIFLDSPMAIEVTELYHRRRRVLEAEDVAGSGWETGQLAESILPGLQLSRTVEESMAINRIHGGAVIIAGSGMCTGGRIRHHLKYNLGRRNCRIVIAGFQAQGTLGRQLVDGAETVRLFGEDHPVRATVHTLGGFSAHAGQSELLAWAGRFRTRPRVFLVHGEPEAQQALQRAMKEQLGIDAVIPEPGQTEPV